MQLQVDADAREMEMTDPLDLPLMRTLRFIPPELEHRDEPKYEPTPEQIREMTTAIRQGWSPQVERARRGEVDRRYVEVTETILPQGITEREVMW